MKVVLPVIITVQYYSKVISKIILNRMDLNYGPPINGSKNTVVSRFTEGGSINPQNLFVALT